MAQEFKPMDIATAVDTIISMYRSGAPSRERLNTMLFRYAPAGQFKTVEQELKARMGTSYPKR